MVASSHAVEPYELCAGLRMAGVVTYGWRAGSHLAAEAAHNMAVVHGHAEADDGRPERNVSFVGVAAGAGKTRIACSAADEREAHIHGSGLSGRERHAVALAQCPMWHRCRRKFRDPMTNGWE